MAMIRDTAQRRAIRKVLAEADRPLSPDEILAASKRIVPNLGMATVYRSVKSLVEEDWLVAVDVPGEAQRYEQAGMAHHHHFNCRVCGRVYDFHGCPTGLDKLVPPGFKMDDHEIYLYGTCAGCR
jgi:Fur family transcriptional regulator, ferric uptake regulator